MKKRIKNVLLNALSLLLLCFVLVSCASQGTTGETTVTTTGMGNSKPTGDIKINYIYDINEYRAYIASANYSNNFVHYDCIVELGEFVTFGYYPGYSDYYWYVLQNGKQELWLHVRPQSDFAQPVNSVLLSSSVNDLTTVKQIGTTQIGAAWYHFNDGIHMIEWTDKINYYQLSGFDSPQSFEKGSILNQLCYRDTALTAIEKLNENIRNGK